MKTENASLPSRYLPLACEVLRVDAKALQDAAARADAYHRMAMPGKPSITMAAFTWVRLARRGSSYRSERAVARAFEVGEDAVRKRIKEIRRN